MAVSLSAPTFSFVTIDELPTMACSWYDRPCLPVYEVNDLAFQLYASVTGADKETFNDAPIHGSITLDCVVSLLTERNWEGTWTKIETGEGSNPDIWVGNFVKYNDEIWALLEVNQCFNILFYREGDSETLACSTVCFKKIDDTCYTSEIGYRNNENAFDFNYDDPTFFNRVRLPLYLHSPQTVEEEKSYAKSNGASVKLMHRIWFDYKLKSDYQDAEANLKMVIATAHDGVFITCSYSGLSNAQFIRTEKVDIKWMEEESPGINIAQAVTTLRFAEPVQNVNSNCNS